MSTCSNVLRASPSAERILVIRLGALGDVLRTIPAVAALRTLYPASRIDWLVEPASAGAVALAPAVDRVLVFPRPELVGLVRSGRFDRLATALREQADRLREAEFDLVADFHGILKSGVLARLTGASMRVGFARPHAREGNRFFSTHRVELGATKRSRYERNAALAEYLGARPPAAGGRFLAIPQDVTEAVSRRIGRDRPGPVLHPGTSPGTPHKRWAPERFASLARSLEQQTGTVCLVTCGPDEAERRLARDVVARSGGTARLAPETHSLPELAALLSLAPLLVGNDSGPLHLASLVGTPVVQILGPTDPVENAPLPSTPNRVVHVPVPCSPCRRGCGNPICMDAVTVERVADAARSLLALRSEARSTPPWRAA